MDISSDRSKDHPNELDGLRDRNTLYAGASLSVLSLINIRSNQADAIGQRVKTGSSQKAPDIPPNEALVG